MVPPKIPPPTGDLFAPLTPLQGALVEERGHSTRALPYPAQARLGEIISVPRSLCGAVQITALSGSFGHICASRNARVTGFALRGHPFSSAPPLGRGFHSPLWRQTANNGTSWRLICASRARSRTDVRLGRASRACSPPICTILRRLIKLVCALLRFTERPGTIEVHLATLSA